MAAMASKADTDTLEHASTATVEEADSKPHPRDVDDALNFATQIENVDWTEAEEKKVVWKIDAVILSLVRPISRHSVDLYNPPRFVTDTTLFL